MKREVVNALAKHVANPVMRPLAGRIPGWALLETTGRRSGLPRRTPVGDGLRGDTFWIVAEHGGAAQWVRNVEADPRVRVRTHGRWRSGTAHVLEDDDPRERLRWLGGINPWIVRLAGTDPLTVRVDLDPAPPRGGSALRDGIVAGLVAGAVSGLPSGLHALRRGYLPDLLRAPGALLAPGAGRGAQLALTLPVHAALSAGWGTVLAATLPRRRTAAWGAAAGATIGLLDIVLIGRWIPPVRRLPIWPQLADHVAFGAICGWGLAELRRGQPRPISRASTRRSPGGSPNGTSTAA